MTVTYHLIPVAFLKTTGGELHVLLAVDEGEQQLFEGEPALLVAHRPFQDHGSLRVEGADALAAEATDAVLTVARQLAEHIDGAHLDDGSFDGERLLGRRIALVAGPRAFELRSDS